MNKYIVECNIRTGMPLADGPDLWIHVMPTDGRPMEFTNEAMAYQFMAELEDAEGTLDYRVTEEPATLGEVLEDIMRTHTKAELRKFATTINSMTERQPL